VAGSVIVDQNKTHNVYIPFVRLDPNGNFYLYVAVSTDGATTWTRHLVAPTGPANPAYIFPNIAIDTAGNLYYDWVQDQGNAAKSGGETDVYYAFSTSQGATWSQPVDLTPETGDSAVFPWMVAGSPGNVDLTFYKANSGLNPDFAANAVWNVYFAQSQNALNTGSNFKTVQISDHPNHLGAICTGGFGCTGNRDLLDFFTIDVDHLGAANITWADDNNSQQRTFDKFSRQLSGNSVFANTTINLTNSWGITDHAVNDAVGDVYNSAGVFAGSCTGMDILQTSESYSGTILTVSLSLNGPPTNLNAKACGGVASGGIWGAEFWASALAPTNLSPNDNFYIAYRDDGVDPIDAEAGRVNAVNTDVTSSEFQMNSTSVVTFGGNCFPTAGAPNPCTLTLSTDLSVLGVKAGAGLYSITGLSLYYIGSSQSFPGTNLKFGDSEHADAAPAFDDEGTGTTTN
jgi:hypothetical protein